MKVNIPLRIRELPHPEVAFFDSIGPTISLIRLLVASLPDHLSALYGHMTMVRSKMNK
jgi:hypothetical protein